MIGSSTGARVPSALLEGVLKWLIVVSILVLSAVPADAGILRVEKDGTGDYLIIQNAVDAAASGDTILIGPGRFTETTLYPIPGGEYTPQNYVVVDEKTLTLLGSGKDVTIIGPEEPWYTTDRDPYGIAVWSDTTSITVKDLTVENVARGVIVSHNDVWISNSTIRGCNLGVNVWVYGGGEISQCEFYDNYTGLLMMTCEQRMEVYDLVMADNTMALSIQYSDSVYVSNCDIVNSKVCILYSMGASGEVRSCNCTDIEWYGITASEGTELVVDDCRVEGGEYIQVECASCIELLVTDSIFTGGGMTTARAVNGQVEMHRNHILNSGGYSLMAMPYPNPPLRILDFTNNYWGTFEADSLEVDPISALIWDGHDDPSIHAIVDYQPFSPIPLPSEQKSMGDIKRMFRDATR